MDFLECWGAGGVLACRVGATVTKHHSLGGLLTTETSHSFGGWKFQIRVAAYLQLLLRTFF